LAIPLGFRIQWNFLRGGRMHLHEMFELQNRTNSRFVLSLEKLKTLPLLEVSKCLDTLAKHIIGESVELQEALGPEFYKSWKNREVFLEDIQMEAIDIFNLALAVCMISGLDTPDALHDAFIKKWAKNNSRKDWTLNQKGNV